MRRAFFLTVTFSIFAASAFTQSFYHSTRNYTAIDGLPQSQVMAMVEDKNGYLWIGTQGGGLARFDGRTFKVYTTLDGLLANQVIGLEFDRDDNLWIAHPKGVTKYDGLTFKQFKAGGAQGVRSARRVYNVNDTILVVGHGLITKIHNDSVYYWDKKIFDGRMVWRTHQSSEGQTYFYLSDSTIVVRSAEKSSTIQLPEEMGRINNMFNYKNDVMLQTANGIFRLDSKLGHVEKLPWNIRWHVLTYDEKEDEFWTIDENTLYKEKLEDGVFVCTTILSDVFIRQVLLDSEGNVWLASDGRGLYKYFIQDFIKCSSENMRSVMAVTKDHDGTTWIGTIGKGLWSIKKGKTNHYDTKNPKEIYRNNIQCLKEAPDGTLWVGTGHGLGRYNRENDTFRWYTRADGLSGDGIVCIDFDENGMWVGTGNGLSYYDGTKFTTYNRDSGLAANMIYAMHYHKKYKTLYIGTETAINTYKNGKVGTVSIPEMANTTVLSLHAYKDSLLAIGTSGAGVVILNPETGQRKSLTTRDGMASDFVYFVGVDENDYLWIGTEKGINHVKLGNHYDVIENLHFGYDNGLVGVETNQNAYYLSPTTKFFGLVDGVYQFNDLSNERPGSFDLHLTDVQILYGEYSPRDYTDSTYSFFKIPSKPVLPPDKNHLTFQFNRVDKQYSNSVKYKYLMENFDKTWSLPASTNEVTYSNLPPGDYVFRVMSTDSKGSWSKTQIVYPFSIRPPFYMTTSFIVGMLIFAGGLITLVMYIRVKQRVNRIVILERIRQREQEALRKEIARDFHDEMGNQLTRIINYVSLLKMNGNGNGHDLYAKVENSAKYLYTGTRDFIWAIDPVNDDMAKLFLHIRDFGEKLFDEKNISFRAINKVMDDQKLPYGFSREANLIFKEAMTNAFKSSCARNVTLSLEKDEHGNFELSLEDDGVGFNPGEVENSNGLKNIRERANRINSLLRIHSVKNEGTKIVLSFTLTKTKKYGLAF
jgi:ligand-binding sensor domain-containing protein/signal transduction histidine kinase